MDDAAGLDGWGLVHGCLLGSQGDQVLEGRSESPSGVVESFANSAGSHPEQVGELTVGPCTGVTQDEQTPIGLSRGLQCTTHDRVLLGAQQSSISDIGPSSTTGALSTRCVATCGALRTQPAHAHAGSHLLDPNVASAGSIPLSTPSSPSEPSALTTQPSRQPSLSTKSSPAPGPASSCPPSCSQR
jgi:hypothetical protein